MTEISMLQTVMAAASGDLPLVQPLPA